MNQKKREEYHVRSVQRALSILNCFSIEKPYLGVTEISKMVNLHKSIIHALLVTMEDEGFVKKDAEKDQYYLTYKLLRLGNIVSENLELKNVALPFMYKLRDFTQESVALNVYHNRKRLVIAVVESNMPVRLFIHVGQVLHLHSNAAGKILLAWRSKESLKKIIEQEGLPQLTPNTITDPNQLMKELEKIRDQKFALCNGEGFWDAGSVGAPIRDFTGEVVAALTVYGPLSRYQGNQLETFISKTMTVADEISQSLGFDEKESTYYQNKDNRKDPNYKMNPDALRIGNSSPNSKAWQK